MKIILSLICISNFLFAQEIVLEQVLVEESILEDSTYVASEDYSLSSRSISLQNKLQRDVSFSEVSDLKGDKAISFRGLNYKNTNYVEDGIPLYRDVNGFVDANFNRSQSAVKMMDGSGVSSLGVSSTGGEVQIQSLMPNKELELKLNSSLSNNDQFYHAHLGSLQDNFYIQTDANYYYRSDYTLSDNYTPTSVQDKAKRVNSDRVQKSFSFKSGVFLSDNLHIAAKLSVKRLEYGIPPNTQTDIEAPVWDAYSRIDEKDLNTYNFYLDYSVNNLDLSLRAYYDQYSDIYEIYNEPTYETTLPAVTYDDSRLGTILNASLNSSSMTNTVIFQIESNEHIRRGGELSTTKNQLGTFKLSYLNEFEINQLWNIQSGISYSLLKELKASEAAALNPAEDKKAFDAQIKLEYFNQGHMLYAAIAKKNRMPSMVEMFTFFPWENANPDLDPEKTLQYTTGYQYSFNKQSKIDTTLYYYDINDLIIYRENTFINRESAINYGAEIRFSSELKKHNLGLSYSYAYAQDSEKEVLELIPKHQVKIEDQIALNKTLEAFFSYQYLSSRYSSNSATYTDEQKSLDAYHLLEMQLSYDFSESINARLGIKNLLDEDYEWKYGYPGEGRVYYLSLAWQL